MGLGGQAYLIYWMVAFCLWTVLGLLPFRKRSSYGWRLFLGLYLLASVVIVVSAGTGGPSVHVLLLFGPGALIAFIRLMTYRRGPGG
ncbi:hypothetical protein F4557_007006 [Actinomadura catellatispora]|nr:hypothetical protein [Actinomadura catellatispora]